MLLFQVRRWTSRNDDHCRRRADIDSLQLDFSGSRSVLHWQQEGSTNQQQAGVSIWTNVQRVSPQLLVVGGKFVAETETFLEILLVGTYPPTLHISTFVLLGCVLTLFSFISWSSLSAS